MTANNMTTDQIFPVGRWAFDEDVTAVFDDMLNRSIPSYGTMRKLCYTIGRRFVRPQTSIVDLGCSNGLGLVPFLDEFGVHNRYYGCDVSEPMLSAARERFKGFSETGMIKIEHLDLRTSYPSEIASLTLSTLTLMFVPIEHRTRLLRDALESTVNGGALILVEKILCSNIEMHELLTEEYHRMKLQNGYTQEQVDRKALSLEGVLVPLTVSQNEEMLRLAGFDHVEMFWRHLNFAAWVATVGRTS